MTICKVYLPGIGNTEALLTISPNKFQAVDLLGNKYKLNTYRDWILDNDDGKLKTELEVF